MISIKAIAEFKMFLEKNEKEVEWEGKKYSLKNINIVYQNSYETNDYSCFDIPYLTEFYLTLRVTLNKSFKEKAFFIACCQSIVSNFATKNKVTNEDLQHIFNQVDTQLETRL